MNKYGLTEERYAQMMEYYRNDDVIKDMIFLIMVVRGFLILKLLWMWEPLMTMKQQKEPKWMA